MARLLIHVEGQTEEDFVNHILRYHLLSKGYHDVSARIIGNARLRRRRGGIRSWPSVRRDISNHLREDRGCIATTMVDFYGLPQQGLESWPGRAVPSSLSTIDKALHVEKALLADLTAEMGGDFDPKRFVPFVVMHKFEGLLFSDCSAFSRAVGQPALEHRLIAVRTQYATPEDIDDSPATAPSKRIIEAIPEYEKPLYGALAIMEIGLSRIRRECGHFNDWLNRLELLA